MKNIPLFSVKAKYNSVEFYDAFKFSFGDTSFEGVSNNDIDLALSKVRKCVQDFTLRFKVKKSIDGKGNAVFLDEKGGVIALDGIHKISLANFILKLAYCEIGGMTLIDQMNRTFNQVVLDENGQPIVSVGKSVRVKNKGSVLRLETLLQNFQKSFLDPVNNWTFENLISDDSEQVKIIDQFLDIADGLKGQKNFSAPEVMILFAAEFIRVYTSFWSYALGSSDGKVKTVEGYKYKLPVSLTNSHSSLTTLLDLTKRSLVSEKVLNGSSSFTLSVDDLVSYSNGCLNVKDDFGTKLLNIICGSSVKMLEEIARFEVDCTQNQAVLADYLLAKVLDCYLADRAVPEDVRLLLSIVDETFLKNVFTQVKKRDVIVDNLAIYEPSMSSFVERLASTARKYYEINETLDFSGLSIITTIDGPFPVIQRIHRTVASNKSAFMVDASLDTRGECSRYETKPIMLPKYKAVSVYNKQTFCPGFGKAGFHKNPHNGNLYSAVISGEWDSFIERAKEVYRTLTISYSEQSGTVDFVVNSMCATIKPPKIGEVQFSVGIGSERRQTNGSLYEYVTSDTTSLSVIDLLFSFHPRQVLNADNEVLKGLYVNRITQILSSENLTPMLDSLYERGKKVSVMQPTISAMISRNAPNGSLIKQVSNTVHLLLPSFMDLKKAASQVLPRQVIAKRFYDEVLSVSELLVSEEVRSSLESIGYYHSARQIDNIPIVSIYRNFDDLKNSFGSKEQPMLKDLEVTNGNVFVRIHVDLGTDFAHDSEMQLLSSNEEYRAEYHYVQPELKQVVHNRDVSLWSSDGCFDLSTLFINPGNLGWNSNEPLVNNIWNSLLAFTRVISYANLTSVKAARLNHKVDVKVCKEEAIDCIQYIANLYDISSIPLTAVGGVLTNKLSEVLFPIYQLCSPNSKNKCFVEPDLLKGKIQSYGDKETFEILLLKSYLSSDGRIPVDLDLITTFEGVKIADVDDLRKKAGSDFDHVIKEINKAVSGRDFVSTGEVFVLPPVIGKQFKKVIRNILSDSCYYLESPRIVSTFLRASITGQCFDSILNDYLVKFIVDDINSSLFLY